MKNNIKVHFVILALLICSAVFIIGCKKEAAKVAPTLITSSILNITANSATAGGNITSDGNASITARGVCWSNNQNPTISDSKTSNGTSVGSFTSNIRSLTPGVTYYVRAFATNSVGTAYGSQITFSTLTSVPVLVTSDITSISSKSANSGGNITNDGGSPVITRGVCWSTNQNPTTSDNNTTNGTGVGIFTSSINGLTSGTTYYVRAYAINNQGIAYGNQVSFVTLVSQNLPSLTTNDISSITSTSAVCGGYIINDGGYGVIVYGVCWSTNQNPTIANNKTTDGSGSAIFTSDITNLTAGTTYYVRAYATNSRGTSYGNQVSFATLATSPLPVLTTTAISSITSISAISGGNITSDGGYTVTERGVCWSTNQTPTIVNSKTADGYGIGGFTSTITNLTAGTTYYVRAYATNSLGTSYGSQITFTALATQPVLLSTAATLITGTSASAGGNITSDGGASVTARGVCWNTAGNLTVSDNKTSNGTGTGTFTSNLTGLAAITKYYTRAYATNSQGTSYGNQITFNTLMLGSEIGTVEDQEGHVYKTVKIGNQWWMAENLFSRYFNIPKFDFGVTSFTSPTYVDYNNTYGYSVTYGRLYNWFVVNSSDNICPTNWHIPTKSEWGILFNYLGGNYVAGGKLKEVGTAHWNSPNVGATDEVGFTALPGGYGFFLGGTLFYNSKNDHGNWWTSTEASSTAANIIEIDAGNAFAWGGERSKQNWLSVRCIRDNTQGVPVLSTKAITNVTQSAAESGGNITHGGGSSILARGVCWNTSGNPSINDNKTSNGTGEGDYISNLSGLSPNTTYYLRAYATNSTGAGYGDTRSFTTTQEGGLYVTDMDGNIYHTVTIGSQIWTVENLRTTRLRDGTAIDTSYAWYYTNIPGFRYYNEDQTLKGIYGLLYNFYAVESEKLCPSGWHVPSDAEWTVLTTFLGGEEITGGKLKSTTLWNSPNTGANNESGFTGLPGGMIDKDGVFKYIKEYGDFWSSTSSTNGAAYERYLSYNLNKVTRYILDKSYGLSVRCIKD